MILKLTLDLFKEHIHMFSDQKKKMPWAHGNQGGGQCRRGGICCLLPPSFEIVCSTPLQARDPAAAMRLSCKNITKNLEKSV